MDLKKLMGGLSKSGALSGFMGGAVGGGAISMLTSKKGRKVGKGALKVGALAAVGGLAWKAYQQYSAKSQPQGQLKGHQQLGQQPQTSGFDYAPASIPQQQFEDVTEDTNPCGQMLLMRAMIAAAHSDGHIDDAERLQIFSQVDTMDLSLEVKAALFDELRKPLTIVEIVVQVPDAQTGIEVYAASASAIDLTHQDSQAYLDTLASQLCIPYELTTSIQQQLQAD